MFKIERLQMIRQILKEQSSVDVIGLSNALKVSEVTIRRDLEELENEGFLKRTYGGAVIHDQPLRQSEEELEEEPKEKFSEMEKSFGEICMTLVEDYDVIFLGRGESIGAFAEYLCNRTEIVVFTNNLKVLKIMEKDENNRVILVGGEVDYKKEIICSANENIPFPPIVVNKAFLQVHGVDLRAGISVNNQEDAYIYRQIKTCSKNIVAIMPGSVYDKSGLIKVDDIEGVQYAVTDTGIPDDYKRCFYKNGTYLHQKFEL